ncbi:MAG: PQQ-dependent sugar dehydrogenase [Pirellulaceae bacterium]
MSGIGRMSPWRAASSCLWILGIGVALGSAPSRAQEARPQESDYYRIVTFQTPEGVELEATSFQRLPDGKLAVASRRGEIWMVSLPMAESVTSAQFQRFAHGLHEPIGLAWKDGWLYVTQRSDVSRLKDQDGDGEADLFEVVADGWGITGDYHEYAFGSKFDRQGNLWVALCLTGSFGSDAPFRGWAMRITPDGKTVPTTSGLRSPGGVGMNLDGDVFYTDNQGPWNGTCALKQLSPGKFVGHPGGFRWYEQASSEMGPRPMEPKDGSRWAIEADRIPEFQPPVILFPYGKMGQSAAGIAADSSEGGFGPFAGQLFVGDQTHSTVMRCALEKVDGQWQGACFPFREGFDCGVVGLEMSEEGSLFVGGTNRGWGSRGGKPFCVQRLDWTGRVPFELHRMEAVADGFVLHCTEPVDVASATDIASYRMSTFTYIFQSAYGSPEVDPTEPKIVAATVGEDGKSISLKIEGLQRGHVHHLKADGLRAKDGRPLLHADAYYTLMRIPQPAK